MPSIPMASVSLGELFIPPDAAPTSISAPSAAIVEAWNVMARRCGLSVIRAMPRHRQVKLQQRIKEVGFGGMLEAIAALGESDFCRGKNSRAWTATFDFLLQPSSLLGVLERKYANRAAPRETFRNGAMELLMREAEADATMTIDAQPIALPTVRLLALCGE